MCRTSKGGGVTGGQPPSLGEGEISNDVKDR